MLVVVSTSLPPQLDTFFEITFSGTIPEILVLFISISPFFLAADSVSTFHAPSIYDIAYNVNTQFAPICLFSKTRHFVLN